MNIFIVRLKTLDTGCCISGYFLVCFLYAGDIILLSASVSGLQSLLNCCYDVSQDVLIVVIAVCLAVFQLAEGIVLKLVIWRLGQRL